MLHPDENYAAKNRTSAAKAVRALEFYGTTKAVPFVEGRA